MTRINVFIKDKNKKNIFQITHEFVSLILLKKELPLYYFGKFLYRKNVHNYRDYLSAKETRTIWEFSKPNDIYFKELIRNKLLFSHFIEKNKIPGPKVFGHSTSNEFYYRKTYLTESTNDIVEFFKTIFTHEDIDAIFIKPFDEQGGKDCYILHYDTMENQIKNLKKVLIFGSFIFQKVIEEHPSLNAINAKCVNSIRFNSIHIPSTTPEILTAYIRFGTGNNVMDNSRSGGFYVPVNLKTGTLKSEGKQLMHYGGDILHEHPESHYNFDGFAIPFFEESCQLVKKVAPLIPYKMLGWDIAIEKKGTVIIEANDNFSLFASDIADEGYLNHSIIKDILKPPYEKQ